MGARLRSWWQQVKQRRVTILVVGIILIVAIGLIIIGYRFDWTGFNGNSKSGKTLWDWLNLLGVLAVPVVVGFGAVWFTTRQGKVADAENKDNQRETALQTYIDKMSELLLHENLRESQPENEVRNVARVRTLTVLRGLDPIRKASVLQFLHESGLIDIGMSIIDLSGADLKGASLFFANLSEAALSRVNLFGANLEYANLSGVNLSRASLWSTNLSNANLSNTNLSGANLTSAKLNNVDLEGANLKGAMGVTIEKLEKLAKSLKGATMPDGSIHP